MIEQERISYRPFPGEGDYEFPTFVDAVEIWEDNGGIPISEEGVLIGTHGDTYQLVKNDEGSIALKDACGQLVTSWCHNAVDIFAVDTDDDGHDEIYVQDFFIQSISTPDGPYDIEGTVNFFQFRHVIDPDQQCAAGEFWRSGRGVYQDHSRWP